MALPLRPFQQIGIDYLSNTAIAMLCDDAGLGKSAMVLRAAGQLGTKDILVIGPAVSGVSWPIEVSKWSPGRKYAKMTDLVSRGGGYTLGTHSCLVFVSYDALSRDYSTAGQPLMSAIRRGMFDLIVLDEAQYLKNPSANRTKAVYGKDCDGIDDPNSLIAKAKAVWVLSGTLCPNHVGECYSHLRALFPDKLREATAMTAPNGRPDSQAFEDIFCRVKNTNFGRVIEGSRNQNKLRASVSGVLLRRRKAEVLSELPAIDWLVAPLTLDPDVVSKIMQDMGDAFGLGYTPSVAEVEIATPGTQAALVDFIASNPNLASQRRSLGLAKVPSAVEWIEDRLNSGEHKIVVFAHHTEVIEQIAVALQEYGVVTYTGKSTPAGRASAVDFFQNDPRLKVRVFVGQIQAAGTAITLTAAKTVFFAEYSGTPAVNYQAASRVHRLGQRDGVQAYFGSVPGTLDDVIARTAARRARELAEMFD